jgi:hypothetical protein
VRIKTDRATQVLTVADGDANTPGMQEFSPRPGGLEHQTPREVTAQSLPHREDAELLGPTERPPTMKSTAATGGEVSFVAFDGLRGMLALWVAIGHFTYFSAWHNNLLNTFAMPLFFLLSGCVICAPSGRPRSPSRLVSFGLSVCLGALLHTHCIDSNTISPRIRPLPPPTVQQHPLATFGDRWQ